MGRDRDNALVHAEEASYLLDENSGNKNESSGPSSSSSKRSAFAVTVFTAVAILAVIGIYSMHPTAIDTSSVAKSRTNLGLFDGIEKSLHFHAANKEDSIEVTDSPKSLG